MRTLKFQFMISTFALGLAACSTAPAPKSSLDARLIENAKAYKISVHSMKESEVSPGQCFKWLGKVDKNWDWKAAVAGANACMRSKDYSRAESLANELATREPSAPWGPYYLGMVARENGNLEKALWMCELALKRAPEIGVLHYLKGQILWSQKDYKNAVASFEKAIELDPLNVPAQLFLGQVYYRDQDFSKASKRFYAVLKVEPRQPVALAGLAESQLHENDPQGALDAYNRLAEAYPHDGQYLSRIGEIYETVLNDMPQALTTYRQVRTLVRNGTITKNIDFQIDSKVRELEAMVQKTRSVASSEEKKGRAQR